ncbi:MAG: ABC transporter substrate-binding protein [Thermoanaerobaculales bacterium]|nr:ABC transporter substrate-binding protein [Thermoanaerobaculales bacterium]
MLCSIPAFEPILEGLKEQLGQLGYEDGVDVTYEVRFRDDREPAPWSVKGEPLLARGADLLFAFPTEAAIAAKEVASSTGLPVVFAYAGIENSNLVDGVRVPGGNITGVRFPGPEQIGKRLELIHSIAPQVKRIWVGYHREYPNTAPALGILRPLARAFGLELVEVPVSTLDELEADLAGRSQQDDPGMDAMLIMPDGYNHSPRGWELIRDFADRHRLPLAGSFLYTVEEGAVFGNANDLKDVGRYAAPLVAKIFAGIPAGTIPVVTPEQDLYVNIGRTQELGLEVPEGLLRQAKVIIH